MDGSKTATEVYESENLPPSLEDLFQSYKVF